MQVTSLYYQVQDGQIVKGPVQRPTHIGENSDPADFGYYPYVIQNDATPPSEYYTLTDGGLIVEAQQRRVVRINVWKKMSDDEIRAAKEEEIRSQEPYFTLTDYVHDVSGVTAALQAAKVAIDARLQVLAEADDPASVDTRLNLQEAKR